MTLLAFAPSHPRSAPVPGSCPTSPAQPACFSVPDCQCKCAPLVATAETTLKLISLPHSPPIFSLKFRLCHAVRLLRKQWFSIAWSLISTAWRPRYFKVWAQSALQSLLLTCFLSHKFSCVWYLDFSPKTFFYFVGFHVILPIGNALRHVHLPG